MKPWQRTLTRSLWVGWDRFTVWLITYTYRIYLTGYVMKNNNNGWRRCRRNPKFCKDKGNQPHETIKPVCIVSRQIVTAGFTLVLRRQTTSRRHEFVKQQWNEPDGNPTVFWFPSITNGDEDRCSKLKLKPSTGKQRQNKWEKSRWCKIEGDS